MSDTSPAGAPVCYRHPGREAHIRCQRCERPICPDCMVPAAVGFQCPECVREGAKSVRSPQAPYGGRPSTNPLLVAYVLIAVNVAVWLAVRLAGAPARLVDLLALSPAGKCFVEDGGSTIYVGVDQAGACRSIGGSWEAGALDGAPWQLLTSAFTHVEIWHIALNMFVLWQLWPQLEMVLGRMRAVAVYLLSALGGSVFVVWLADPLSSSVGASGAISGLVGALVVLLLKLGRSVAQFWFFAAIAIVLPLLIPGLNISWQAHLGGAVTGAAATAVIAYAPRTRRGLVQALGLGSLLLALVAATIARAVLLAG